MTINANLGQKISTKGIGHDNFNRVDITDDYKYPEGSALELITVKRAMRLSHNKIIKDMPQDLKFELSSDPHVPVGKDIALRLNIRNSGTKNLPVRIMIGGNIVMYNGMALDKIPLKRWDIMVKRQDGKNCFLVCKSA